MPETCQTTRLFFNRRGNPTLMWAWGFNANAQDQVFVSIANFPGESTDANHAGWIDAYALDDGLSVSATLRPLVVIEVCRAGTSPQQCYYRVELSNVFVTGVQLSGSSCVGSGGPTPPQTESVSLTYSQIKWEATSSSRGVRAAAPPRTTTRCTRERLDPGTATRPAPARRTGSPASR